jgi:hypothetical protein
MDNTMLQESYQTLAKLGQTGTRQFVDDKQANHSSLYGINNKEENSPLSLVSFCIHFLLVNGN